VAEDISIKLDPIGNLAVFARRVDALDLPIDPSSNLTELARLTDALDLPSGTLEIDTKGVFFQSTPLVPDLKLEKIEGITIIKMNEY
jgi:hypothetical protein